MTADGSTNPWCCLRLQRRNKPSTDSYGPQVMFWFAVEWCLMFVLLERMLQLTKSFNWISRNKPFVFWLVVWNMCYVSLFSIYWECHHPKWRSHIFQRGRAQPPTSVNHYKTSTSAETDPDFGFTATERYIAGRDTFGTIEEGAGGICKSLALWDTQHVLSVSSLE